MFVVVVIYTLVSKQIQVLHAYMHLLRITPTYRLYNFVRTHTIFSVLLVYTRMKSILLLFLTFLHQYLRVCYKLYVSCRCRVYLFCCVVRAAICEHITRVCERQGISHNFHRSDEIICVRNANTIQPIIPYASYIYN